MSQLLKSVVILTNPRGAHDPAQTYAKMDEVQYQTSIYVAAEDIPAGVAITDPRWVCKLDNNAAYQAERERIAAEQDRDKAERARGTAEQNRETASGTAVSNANAAAAAANTAAGAANTAAGDSSTSSPKSSATAGTTAARSPCSSKTSAASRWTRTLFSGRGRR